jgi:hydrogenase expression/formation protein HypC
MCLAIPGKVVEISREREMLTGKVDFGGVFKQVCLECVPDVSLGEFVLVHVGFALAKIDETEARRVFELLNEMNELDELRQDQADEVPG